MKKPFKIFVAILATIFLVIASGVIYVKAFLPNTGEAPAITIEKTPELVERGRYLANHVTVCMDCHSTRDWTKYAAPLAGNLGAGGERFGREMGFPGNFFAKNITPYALANWTDGEIFRTITTGVNKDGVALFPVMPYHGYGKMATEDIYSIVAYIRSLKPIESTIPAREVDFPVSILINTIPQEAHPSPLPGDEDVVAKGAYLVNAAGCVECHSQRDKGALVLGTEFGGGMSFPFPAGTVTSANISSDEKTGIGSWSEAAFLHRFQIYNDSSYVAPTVGPKDMNTTMPWSMYAGMKSEDLKAIYAYLKTVKPISNKVVKFIPNAQ